MATIHSTNSHEIKYKNILVMSTNFTKKKIDLEPQLTRNGLFAKPDQYSRHESFETQVSLFRICSI